MERTGDFDVLLSFAGPERVYARAIADICNANGLNVFLDEDFQHEIWGKNLVEYLDELYRTGGKYCVALISQAYCDRAFTRVERRAAFDRMIQHAAEYFLPICVDDTWPQGLPKSTAYLDLRTHGVIGICELLIRKVTGRRERLIIPPEIHVPRVPLGQLSAEHLATYLTELCQQQPVTVFGTVVYDETTAEIRKLFSDQAYWDALDAASGPHFEVFTVRDQEDFEIEHDDKIEYITAASLSRSRSRTFYFSRLLKECFGEVRTRIAYPSVLLFIVANGAVHYSRLIPLRRTNVEELFLRLQAMFKLIAGTIAEWNSSDPHTDLADLWKRLKEKLLQAKYTIYIQRSPNGADQAVSGICAFVDTPASSETGSPRRP